MNQRLHFPLKPLAIFVAASLLPLGSAYAEELDTIKIESSELSDEAGTSNTTIDQEELESKQAALLRDVLRSEAGVDVGGTRSNNQRIFIRGVDDTDLNITLDGVPQNDNIFHHAGNLLIDPDVLKKADIQVGTNSVLTGGLGGGVSFETKDAADLLEPGEKIGARIQAGYASNSSLGGSITAYSQVTDDVDALIYHGYTDSDNPDDGNGNELVQNAGIKENTMIKLGWDVNNKHRLEIKHDHLQDQGMYALRANYYIDPTSDSTGNPTTYARDTTLISHEYDGDDTFVKTSIYDTKLNYQFTRDGSETDVASAHTGINSLAKTQFTNQEVRYGFEYDVTEAGSEEAGSAQDKINKFAIYAEDEIALTSKLYLTPGIRFDSYDVEYAQGVEKTYQEITYGLSTKYLLTDQWTLSASSTTLFDGPPTGEALNVERGTVSEDLKAETGVNTEVGVEYKQQQFIGLDEFGFAVTAFQTNLNDTINDRVTMRGLSTQGDYTITGFEAKVSGSLGDTNAHLSYAHAQVSDLDLGEETGDSISLRLSTLFPEANVSLNWTSNVVLEYNENDTKLEGYDVHNISATWKPSKVKGLKVTAGIDNIFDTVYASQSSDISRRTGNSDLEPGRNIKVTTSYAF